jgi:hypothetical protein
MRNEEILIKLDLINEEIGFLEEVSNPSSLIEEKLEELRTLRHEYERRIQYDKDTTAQDD